jgi:hypothetical protein
VIDVRGLPQLEPVDHRVVNRGGISRGNTQVTSKQPRSSTVLRPGGIPIGFGSRVGQMTRNAEFRMQVVSRAVAESLRDPRTDVKRCPVGQHVHRAVAIPDPTVLALKSLSDEVRHLGFDLGALDTTQVLA